MNIHKCSQIEITENRVGGMFFLSPPPPIQKNMKTNAKVSSVWVEKPEEYFKPDFQGAARSARGQNFYTTRRSDIVAWGTGWPVVHGHVHWTNHCLQGTKNNTVMFI